MQQSVKQKLVFLFNNNAVPCDVRNQRNQITYCSFLFRFFSRIYSSGLAGKSFDVDVKGVYFLL
jgi:hypothetical protein